jgi:hypothetical protein
MRRPIAVAMIPLLVLMFWQVDLETNAVALPDSLNQDYNAGTNPYLPIQWLEPVY